MQARATRFVSVAPHKVWSKARYVALLSALAAIALSLASSAGASADASFQASVAATSTRPTWPCSNGAYQCGTANIVGYGAASWDFYPTSDSGVFSPCGSTYSAKTYFTLASDPGSTLVLDESGNICGLGHDGAAYRGFFNEPPNAWGNPFDLEGSWTVDPASTGQFAGLTGSGTDLVHISGAHSAGSYSGTIS